MQEVMPMPWSATSRYGLAPAPGALGLAQDLLNTAPAAHEPDLLADLASAPTRVSGTPPPPAAGHRPAGAGYAGPRGAPRGPAGRHRPPPQDLPQPPLPG